MKTKLAKLISVLLSAALATGIFASCGGDKGGNSTNNSGSGSGSSKHFDPENDPLLLSTQELDRVFNPFFSTSATDGNIAGMTQIGMLGNNEKGEVTYGDGETVVTKDLEITDNGGVKDAGLQTTYKFVLKNDVRFSDGSYLTMRDVLFNLYVYLDPAYTGSSTIYSTDIVGLGAYRTDSTDENEQDAFMSRFNTSASARINSLVAATTEINRTTGLSKEEFEERLKSGYLKSNPHIFEDYEKAGELFLQELNDDFTANMDTYEDVTFRDEDKNVIKGLLKSDIEAFMYAEGYIEWSKKDKKITKNYSGVNSRDDAISYVYDDKFPSKLDEIIQYWATADKLFSFIANAEMEAFFAGKDKTYTNISGITFANKDTPVIVNGKTYTKAEYEYDSRGRATKRISDGNEVLSITINNIDPKAIWNFGFGVAPMWYYSDAEHATAFDYVSHFGVEFGSQSFMENTVNSSDKVGVPFGAGPYAASKASGGIIGDSANTQVAAGDFYDKGVVYYERNPYYLGGAPIIKKLRYQVVPNAQLLNSLYNESIDYIEPNAKPETEEELKGRSGIESKSVRTNGYGYIGINAGKVPSVYVRRAIMYSINTLDCVNYYKTSASAIYRSMSLESWAYPRDGAGNPNATAYYPYIGGPVPANLNVVDPDYKDFVTSKGKKAGDYLTEAQQKEFIDLLIKTKGGYSLNANGVYQKGNDVLDYDFIVVGDEQDHPAWQAFLHAQEKLNDWGFDINVDTDTNGLKKLSTGDLTVWAAAWGSTIDPDMYQVYHKDSTASSVLNWGYKQIIRNSGNKYDYETRIIGELSELIDEAREYNDNNIGGMRAQIYSDALDLVMELAVELPTYQRNDLFAYNSNKIDKSSLTPDSKLTAYKGLLSDVHLVKLR